MEQFICNVKPSKATENDWQFGDSVTSGALGLVATIPPSVDLRTAWWTINSQESTRVLCRMGDCRRSSPLPHGHGWSDHA